MIFRKIHRHPFPIPQGLTLPEENPVLFENISHTPGQAAAVRFFDPQSDEDLLAVRDILKGRMAKKWMDDPRVSKTEFREWATNTHDSLLFAVLDARTPSVEEMKHVKGFIYLYSGRSEKFRVARMQKQGFLQATERQRYVLEASFAMRPFESGQQTGSGLMSSALRQACLQTQMLLNSPVQPEVIIFAFVDPQNLPAQRTLEASGFERRGQMKYDYDSEEDDVLYILNWETLQRKIAEKMQALFQLPAAESGV